MTQATAAERYKPIRSDAGTISGRDNLSSGGFLYPVKLTEYFETTLNDAPGATPQLYMEFERCDQQWDTGEQAIVRQRLFLTNKEGEPLWEGSDLDTITKTFSDATGQDFLDIDTTEATFVGHFFIIEDEDSGREYTTKSGKIRKHYNQVCREYLGSDFVYAGKVRIIESQGGAAEVDAGRSDEEVATYLADMFTGETVVDLKGGKALDIVKEDSNLAEVKTVLGKPLRGGLVKPKAVLIDLLIENGFATVEDGVFMVEADLPFP